MRACVCVSACGGEVVYVGGWLAAGGLWLSVLLVRSSEDQPEAQTSPQHGVATHGHIPANRHYQHTAASHTQGGLKKRKKTKTKLPDPSYIKI